VLIFAVFTFVETPAGVHAQEALKRATPVTGLQWLQMSMSDRKDELVASLYLLSKNGVELKASVSDYYNGIEAKLRVNPGFYSSELTSILANYVYETEPESRPVLDKFKPV